MVRSAIEAAIDAACGFEPLRHLFPIPPARTISITCEGCGRRGEVRLGENDPVAARRCVVSCCPKCGSADDFGQYVERFYDKKGRECGVVEW